VVNITDKLCTKQGNMGLKSAVYNQERFQIKRGFKSREVSNQERVIMARVRQDIDLDDAFFVSFQINKN
jgi:hypothetical protein